MLPRGEAGVLREEILRHFEHQWATNRDRLQEPYEIMVDGKIKDIDYFDNKESDSSNINIQYVIDRLNNLELTGRNKKELCEIVDVLSDIQKQIYATGVALNQTTKE